MRIALLFLTLGAMISPATTLSDPFAQNQGNCHYSPNPPYSSCDVIGDPQKYDIQKADVRFGVGTATVTLYLNTPAVQSQGGSLTLDNFTDLGVNFQLGDVFFYSPSAPYDPSDPDTAQAEQALKFGVPLMSHGSFIAGDLYQIDGSAVTVEDAQQALNNSGLIYRKDQAVLMSGGGVAASDGHVTVAPYGNGTTNALWAVTATFATTDPFLSLVANHQIGVVFESATCGNDVLMGTVTARVPDCPTPEPRTLVLLAGGVFALCALRRRKAGAAL